MQDYQQDNDETRAVQVQANGADELMVAPIRDHHRHHNDTLGAEQDLEEEEEDDDRNNNSLEFLDTNDQGFVLEDDDDDDDELEEFEETMEEYEHEMEEEEYDSSSDLDVDYIDEEDDVIVQLLSSPNPQKDIRTMRLSLHERTWALAIKQVVEQADDLQPLNDMEYAHYAIITEGNLQNALQRIRGIQTFRETYQVENSVAQGVEMLQAFMTQQPGLLLCLDVDSVTLEGLHVMDIGSMEPRTALAIHPSRGVDYNWRIFILGLYYMNYACQPCLTTIRQGNYTMADFHSMEWRHLDMELQYRFCCEMFSEYPMKFQKFLAYNTGTIATMCWAVLKKVYPPALTGVLQLGCRVPLAGQQDVVAPTLSQQYLRPNREVAYEKLLLRAHDLLSLRVKNEQLYQL